MSKSFGKFLLFTAVAGAAAYGAYSYLQKKEQTASPAANDEDDDFDDFSEDLDEDLNSDKERSYVSLNLDKALMIQIRTLPANTSRPRTLRMRIRRTPPALLPNRALMEKQIPHRRVTQILPGNRWKSFSMTMTRSEMRTKRISES